MRSVMVAHYTWTETERLHLQSIMNGKQMASTYPTAARLTGRYPTVRWSNESSIGTKLIADKATLKDLKFDAPTQDPDCECHLPEWQGWRRCEDGHVCSLVLDCISHDQYRRLCKKGVSFKITPKDSNCVQLMRDAIANHIRSTSICLECIPLNLKNGEQGSHTTS